MSQDLNLPCYYKAAQEEHDRQTEEKKQWAERLAQAKNATVLSKLIASGWYPEEASCALQALWRGGIGEVQSTCRWTGRTDKMVNDLQRLLG